MRDGAFTLHSNAAAAPVSSAQYNGIHTARGGAEVVEKCFIFPRLLCELESFRTVKK